VKVSKTAGKANHKFKFNSPQIKSEANVIVQCRQCWQKLYSLTIVITSMEVRKTKKKGTSYKNNFRGTEMH